MAVATGCSNMLPAVSLDKPHQIPNLHYLIVPGFDQGALVSRKLGDSCLRRSRRVHPPESRFH
jgi:hypothetical protein